LKAGIGSFSVQNGQIGDPTFMQTHSHEMSLPMQHVSDPVNHEIKGLQFRAAKRGVQ
jgi:hypothetical protein